ncbi:MAG: dihydroorotate dehydrogenase [Gemmatimonadetes bacterium]|nr:dihydroorotate dehydrogenase [Gemmatimonadota bacterium]
MSGSLPVVAPPDLSVQVLGVRFQNPVLLAAGTAGFGSEVAGVIELDALGGLVTKAVSVEPRAGNPSPRVAETRGAMLNSVGLANPGLEAVRRRHLPWLREHLARARVLVNVVGRTVDDFVAVVAGLAEEPGVVAFELNVSCPNVERGGMEFGADDAVLADLVRRARAATARPLVVKLSPVLPDPARTAAAAAAAGADAFTAVNTLPALLYDEQEGGRPRLGHAWGGLSGPPLLPVGVRITQLVARETGKPVIGAGGVRSAADARQYFRAGASLVAVGTAALADPRVPERIVRELARTVARRGVAALGEHIGAGR